MQLAAGARFGNYVFERPLGVGAFGVVWLAYRDGNPQLKVAVKILHPQAAVSPESVERFRREARALSQLNSPHIARMYEFIVGPPLGFALVMEYIQGEVLSNVFKRTKLGVEDSIHLGRDLLRGVIEMHANGIIHRDLKPANVMLKPSATGWSAVILDFNLSRFKSGTGADGKPQGSITTMGSAIGTIPFMAPEQIVDARRATETADVYSVGAMLFNAVSGKAPFDIADFRLKLTEEARPVPMSRTDLTATRLAEAIARSLRRLPQERYSSAQEMLDVLSAIPQRAPTLPGST